MGRTERETPDRERRQYWLQFGLRALLYLALAGIAFHYLWGYFGPHGTSYFSGVIRGVQGLAPEAQKRNEKLREMTDRPAGSRDKPDGADYENPGEKSSR
jgi:hypothetical protein